MTPEELAHQVAETNKTESSVTSEETLATRHISHGYQEDLAEAMNATDARVVQEMIQDAREKEIFIKEEHKREKERTWFSLSSVFLFLLALGIGGYGVYHYLHLTVPTQKQISVGVFPSTSGVSANEAPIETIQNTINPDTLKDTTPYLIPIENNDHTLLTNQALFDYLHAEVSEPFAAQFDSIRLGIMRNGTTLSTFLIGSVRDPIIATKELLIAESNMGSLFGPALGVDEASYVPATGGVFSSTYRFNLPIRVATYITKEGTPKEVFYYGFASENVVIIATDPAVLDTVASAIIRQL